MNIFNDDFKDFIDYLNQNEVEYIVVGGYAVIIRGYSRSTGDIDIWVNKTVENFIKLQKVIIAFGLPTKAIKEEDFFSDNFDVFAFGKPPYAIEIMTAVKGLDFKNTYETIKLLHKWIELNDLFQHNFDQRNLDWAVSSMDSLKIYNLPPEYCCIFDLSRQYHGGMNPVIEHFQASRQYR